jgi:conjugative relaxase-like TrwC/TraI family protein
VVLTIRAARNAAYYEAAEFLREEYYAEAGLAEGRYLGREAECLGLEGAPEPGELQALLEGRDPRSGERLPGLRDGRRNAGFDLTFTAPKSASVLLAVGDERVRLAVLAAHEAGVAAGLEYLERHELQARRGAGGQRIVEAHGFLGAAYTHEMSRAGDPHLHTHVVLANAVRGHDGRYSAPDMRPVYHAAKTAGTIAEAVLRHELTRSLGVEWADVVNGTAEIAGIAPEVLSHFSTRHAEIAELVAARDSASLKSVSAAQRETRDRKPEIDRAAARADWRARAAEHGLGRRELARVLHRAAGDPATRPRTLEALEARLAGPRGLTERASTFTRREVVRAFAEAHHQGATPARLEELSDGFLARRAVLLEPAIPERGRRARYATPDLLRAERRLLALAGERDVWLALPEATVSEALAAHPHLGADQQAAVRHLAAGDGRVRILEAHAGRGKTAALRALADAHRQAGDPVLGTAWQGEAAQHLARQAGVPAETAARLLGRLARDPEALPEDVVLVVDEAATMPTRALSELLGHVAARGGRMALVGDRAQLPSVDAGGAFAALADRLGAASLIENRRQRDPLQARVADALSEGRPREALDLLEARGRLQTFTCPEDARAQLVGDWARAALGGSEGLLILAHDRADVQALNQMARGALDRAGLLGPERLVACGREWAAGDRLVCRRNDYRPELEVRNGTRGTVVGVDAAAGTLTFRADDGRVIRLPADYLEHAHHGYALTGHASQGLTVERTYLLASPERGGAEWAYVAASRHRIDLLVYASADDPERVAEALAGAWERRQAKQLATERMESSERAASPVRPASVDREDHLASLRAEHAALVGELRPGGPPDPTETLRALRSEEAGLQAELARAREERAWAESGRAEIGPLRLLRRAGRAEAAHLDGLAESAAVWERRLAADLREISHERAGAEDQLAARHAFAERLPVLCRRLEELETALAGAARPVGDDARGPRPTGPAPALWAERQVLAEHLARGGPPDRAEELRGLERELVRVEGDVAATRAAERGLAGELEAIRPLRVLGPEGRLEARRLQAALESVRERAEDLIEYRRALLGQLGHARAERTARAVWERADAPTLERRIAALGAELARQVEERARLVERASPPYLTEALGGPPSALRARALWREAVRDLEGHRLRHGITDPERALGPEPKEAAGQQAHVKARAALAEARLRIRLADPHHRTQFRLRGRIDPGEHAEPWAPRPDPAPRPRHGPDVGPHLRLGLLSAARGSNCRLPEVPSSGRCLGTQPPPGPRGTRTAPVGGGMTAERRRHVGSLRAYGSQVGLIRSDALARVPPGGRPGLSVRPTGRPSPAGGRPRPPGRPWPPPPVDPTPAGRRPPCRPRRRRRGAPPRSGSARGRPRPG